MRFAEQWTSSTVVSTRNLTSLIREIVLEPDVAVTTCAPGSHINVAVMIDGQADKRSYSLVGPPEQGRLRIAVRLAADSRGGSQAMWALKPGQRIDITHPTSLFEIDWSRQHYALIAGGIGVTPMLGIAAALARRSTELTMH